MNRAAKQLTIAISLRHTLAHRRVSVRLCECVRVCLCECHIRILVSSFVLCGVCAAKQSTNVAHITALNRIVLHCASVGVLYLSLSLSLLHSLCVCEGVQSA